MVTFFLILIVVVILIVAVLSGKPSVPKESRDEPDGREWEYGDVWKQGSPEEPASARDIHYVEILRGDTGTGYDDSFMMDLVSYLGSRGLRATYDSFSVGLEPAAIKTYVLKVESGTEDEAVEYLKEKLKEQSPNSK